MKTLMTILGVAACAASLGVQSPEMAAMAQQFGATAKQNAAALKAYSWKMQVQVVLKGDPKAPKVFLMRFSPDGTLQKTSLTAEQPKQPPQRGLKGRVIEKKTAEMTEYAADLAELCKDYLAPSPALLQAFFAKVQTQPAPGGWVQLYANDVIAPGDRLTYEIDPKTQALHRVLFTATLDKDPVDGTVEIAALPNGGPTYAAKTTVNAPAKKLSAIIQNSEYTR